MDGKAFRSRSLDGNSRPVKHKRLDSPIQEEVEESERLGIAFQGGEMDRPIPRRVAHGGEYVHGEPFLAPAPDRVTNGPARIKGRWDRLEGGIDALQNGQQVRLDTVVHGDRDGREQADCPRHPCALPRSVP